MKPSEASERLKKMENRYMSYYNGVGPEDTNWLIERVKELESRALPGTIYENVIECLDLLKPFEKEGEPNCLLDLMKKALERVHTLEKRNERLKEALEDLIEPVERYNHAGLNLALKLKAQDARKALSEEGTEG